MPKILRPDSNVLITGVTGLIGGEVFRRLVGRGHARRVWTPTSPHRSDCSPA